MATPPDQLRRLTPQPQSRSDGLAGRGLLLAALLTCAFGVGVVVAGYFWMAQPKVANAIDSATGRAGPSAAPVPVDVGAWTDADIRACKEQATAAADIAKKRKLTAVSTDRVGLGGPDAGMVERATNLLCGATHKRLHLCKSYWRNWFMQAIKAHAADFREISMSAYWTKVSVAERARQAAGTKQEQWQTLSDDLDQTTREVAKMHDDISAAFRSLIEDGIIKPDDFGVFLGMGIPPDIAAMIGDASPRRDLCG